MLRLLIFSDLHLEFGRYASRNPYSHPGAVPDADIAVVAGDVHSPVIKAVAYLQQTIAQRMPVIYVMGNHEHYACTIEEELERAREHLSTTRVDCNPVHLLEDDSIVLDGVRFIGSTLWTDYELYAGGMEGEERDREIAAAMNAAGRMINDHRQITEEYERSTIAGFTPFRARRRHRRSRAYIEGAIAMAHDGPTVVVTHHAPHPGSIEDRFRTSAVTPSFVSDLGDVIAQHEPELWVHGHVHSSHDYRVGKTRVVCNPAGYVIDGRLENPDFEPGLVVEVGR